MLFLTSVVFSGNNLENLLSLSQPFPPKVVLPTTPLEVSQIQNLKLTASPPQLIQSMPTTGGQLGPRPNFFKILGGKPVQISAPDLQIFPISGGETGQRPQFFKIVGGKPVQISAANL